MANQSQMQYRRLGNTGVKVSVLSFGSWVTFNTQLDTDLAVDCMQAAHDAGCNFFDNAEAYAGGKSEEIMGKALAQLGWPRWSYMVTTKFFWGINPDPVNMSNTLNRKYLSQAIDASLERFGLDFVDVVYCHRADPNTPIEETVWAMSDMVSQGKALYWGTSEWTADEIRAAIDVAERHHLHKPVTEQSEYNVLNRDKVEVEYARLFEDTHYGNTIWSPLASGLLTGKYKDGIPAESRARPQGLRVARRAGDRRRRARQGGAAAPDRRTPRMLDGATCAGMVHQAPDGVDGDHRRQQAVAGHRELRRARRDPAHHRRGQAGDRGRRQLIGLRPDRWRRWPRRRHHDDGDRDALLDLVRQILAEPLRDPAREGGDDDLVDLIALDHPHDCGHGVDHADLAGGLGAEASQPLEARFEPLLGERAQVGQHHERSCRRLDRGQSDGDRRGRGGRHRHEQMESTRAGRDALVDGRCQLGTANRLIGDYQYPAHRDPLDSRTPCPYARAHHDTPMVNIGYLLRHSAMCFPERPAITWRGTTRMNRPVHPGGHTADLARTSLD